MITNMCNDQIFTFIYMYSFTRCGCRPIIVNNNYTINPSGDIYCMGSMAYDIVPLPS